MVFVVSLSGVALLSLIEISESIVNIVGALMLLAGSCMLMRRNPEPGTGHSRSVGKLPDNDRDMQHNKRMQSDQNAGYAVILAADAGR